MTRDKQITIVPAVLEESVEAIQEKVNRVRDKSERFGVDIIDGVFADNLTVSVGDLALVDFGEMKVEVQLMTEYPTELLGDCKASGVERVFGQIERMGSIEEFMAVAEELGLAKGLAVDLFTPIERIEKRWWERLDGVLLMAVKAGFSGQEFDARVVEKISRLRKAGFPKAIQIDGGISPQTLKTCVEAGADEFSVTSYIWQASDPGKALADLYRVV